MAKSSTRPRVYKAVAAARLCVALGVLALFVFAYLSGSGGGNRLLALLMKSQFTSVLYGHGVASIAVAAAVFSSLLAGRVFCSVICPMGSLQEAFWRISRRLGTGAGGRVRPWRARYAVTLAACVGIILSIPQLALVVDPISLFGRGMTAVRALRDGHAPSFTLLVSAPFAVILLISLFRGRRFCDWCPAGISLGLLSSFAPLGMRISAGCTSCGLCEKKCPTGCVDSKEKEIDGRRCVLCLSCADCPGGFIGFGVRGASKSGQIGRRYFLSSAGSKAAALLFGALYATGANIRHLFRGRGGRALRETGEDSSRAYDGPPLPILPPGGRNVGHYSSRCSGCQACVAACPVKILKASGRLRPSLDYTEDYCQYSCVECGRVCPTGAISSLDVEKKRRTRVALSNLSLNRCVVTAKGQACGACAEVCPTRALRMIPFENAPGLTIPAFDEPYCIGCGACLVVCPARPVAFSLTAVRRQSETPGIRPTDYDEGLPRLPETDDFPF
ncbi:MAG: 4Fe-4S dicluster domain-containing protein [Synergistaceae bacterium]|jgi:ferredoxin|nr:4Fe-4S dicluster domain-containing protein [Synergistaceae bacterium]